MSGVGLPDTFTMTFRRVPSGWEVDTEAASYEGSTSGTSAIWAFTNALTAIPAPSTSVDPESENGGVE
ncbi:hypothetical protein [Myxococcus sp. CA039A]|uniref:hypothetical protein n=1 Tax=Myxococcus sp. CA039A TaxID=2741737 RepID=UPI00157A333B|nr:hypothetical protein [Myxococcus sp. CA039A]NTX54818.1 hypothetical protein [Myxococcus sp. CA039A]